MMSMYSRISASSDDAVSVLQANPLFRGLSEKELGEVAGGMIRRVYGAGVTLFHQGMPGTMIYFIETGSVRVFGIGLTGQEHTFTTFGPGNVFGELAILDGQPRTASAITLEPAVLWLLHQDTFELLLKEHPQLCRTLVDVLVRRIRRAAMHVETIIFQDVLGRIAFELLNLAERHGEPGDAGVAIDMPLTQSDLASIVGATRESVNKALGTLRKRALLEMEGTRLLILDPDGLLEIVERRGR